MSHSGMKVELNVTNILSAIVIAMSLWLGKTVYDLDKRVLLLDYQLDQINKALQVVSEDR